MSNKQLHCLQYFFQSKLSECNAKFRKVFETKDFVLRFLKELIIVAPFLLQNSPTFFNIMVKLRKEIEKTRMSWIV